MAKAWGCDATAASRGGVRRRGRRHVEEGVDAGHELLEPLLDDARRVLSCTPYVRQEEVEARARRQLQMLARALGAYCTLDVARRTLDGAGHGEDKQEEGKHVDADEDEAPPRLALGRGGAPRRRAVAVVEEKHAAHVREGELRQA